MNMKTILEVKDHLRKHYESGTDCPACGQLVKAYKRKLNSNMCRALAIIYSRTKGAGMYIHVQNEFTLLGLRATAMDYTYLEKWKFIESNPDKNGHWRVTDKGKAFVEDTIVVPAYCLVYAGSVYEWSTDTVNMTEALTTRFKLEDVLDLKKLILNKDG
tara:strand:+ start:1099 stop:1575 length:477 start_codon:yes stop_codon:yes gene_type:complete